MAFTADGIGDLLRGPLRTAGPWPLLLSARWCDLRPVFLPKGQVGRHYRAVARNGRVLLASNLPLGELAGQRVSARVQTWHRMLLPGTAAEAYGVLLCLRKQDQVEKGPVFDARLVAAETTGFDLAVEVGALRVLELRRSE